MKMFTNVTKTFAISFIQLDKKCGKQAYFYKTNH